MEGTSEINRAWLLPYNAERFDVNMVYEQQGGECTWTQKRNFEVGDILYLYETAPVSKIMYKAVVTENNLPRTNLVTGEQYLAIRIMILLKNTTNRLTKDDLKNNLPHINNMFFLMTPTVENATRSFIEDVFAGKVANLPIPPTKEELYAPLAFGHTIREQLYHKATFCGYNAKRISEMTGVHYGVVSRYVMNGESTKMDNVIALLKGLDLSVGSVGDKFATSPAESILQIIIDKLNNSPLKMKELAVLFDVSSCSLSTFKHTKEGLRVDAIDRMLQYFNLTILPYKPI